LRVKKRREKERERVERIFLPSFYIHLERIKNKNKRAKEREKEEIHFT